MVLSWDFATIAIGAWLPRARRGLSESGLGLVGPVRGPAAKGAPGLSESGPGLAGPVRFRA